MSAHFIAMWVIILFLLICLSAVFSATETSLTSLNLLRIKELTQKKRKFKHRRKIIYRLTRHYNETLTAILICNNLINILTATLGSLFFTNLLSSQSTGAIVSTIVISVFLLLFGEILPKTFAKIYPEQFILFLAWPLQIIYWFLFPITMIFSLIRIKKKKPMATEPELSELVRIISQEGVLEREERELIQSAINFDEKNVAVAMITREKSYYIYNDTNIEILMNIFYNEPFTRLPVVSRKTGNVVGIINMKDVFFALLKQKSMQQLQFKSLIKPALSVSQYAKLDDALWLMQRKRQHMLIVNPSKRSNEFIGLITFEDLIEELIGETYDEHDKDLKVTLIGRHLWHAYGSVKVNSLFVKYLDQSAPSSMSISLYDWYVKKLRNQKIVKKNGKYPTVHYRSFKIRLFKKSKNKTIFEIIQKPKEKKLFSES